MWKAHGARYYQVRKKKKVPGHDFMLRPVGRCGEEVRGGSEEEEEGTGSRKA